MTHEWKIGDWCEYGGVRCVVIDNNAPDGDLIIVPRFPSCFFEDDAKQIYRFQIYRFPTKEHRDLVHLPDCTGWDWEPPKTIEPPEGHRLLVAGELIKLGDKYFCAGVKQWLNIDNAAMEGAYSVGAHCIHARKIEPKVRPMTRAEFLAAWKQRNFCPLIDTEQDIDAVFQIIEEDEFDNEIINTSKNGWCSLDGMIGWKFLFDETYLTIEE